jgi:hypothetical protein
LIDQPHPYVHLPHPSEGKRASKIGGFQRERDTGEVKVIVDCINNTS